MPIGSFANLPNQRQQGDRVTMPQDVANRKALDFSKLNEIAQDVEFEEISNKIIKVEKE